MTNKFFGTKLLATALATFALASCQSESSLTEPSSNNRRDVELTLTATKGELLTRTDIALDDKELKLIKTWDLGDRIHVCESNGAYVGYLNVTGLNEDKTEATFKGVVSLLDNDGKQTLSFVTLGKGMDAGYKSSTGKQMTAVDYDFTTQVNPASVASLGDYDLMFTDCEVEVKGGNAQFVDLLLKRQFAFGRFTLLYNGEPLQFDANTVVTVDTEAGDIQSAASVEFPKTVSSNRVAALSVTTDKNDFYVKMVPGSEQGRIKFNVTVNGEAYEGYSNSFLIEKNDFFRSNAGGPLPIDVKHVDGRDDEHQFSLVYNANYGANDSWTDNQKGVGSSYTYTVSAYDKIFDETNKGYDFTGWNTAADGSGDAVAVDSEYVVNYPDGTATLYAQWEKKEYTWTIKYLDGYSENPLIKTQEVNGVDNTIVVLDYPSDPVREGYTFAGWTLDGTEAPASLRLSYSKTEINIIATWNEIPDVNYTVTYVNENGNQLKQVPVQSKDTKITFDVNGNKPAPDPAKSGYKFLGWSVDGNTVISSLELTKENPSATLKPVFEKLPTVATPGYRPGQFN